MAEKRHSPFRRQLNEGFCGPDGRFSISKFMAVWGQIMVLAHTGKSFDALIDKPEALLICLSFIIAPDMVKKWLTMKLAK